MEFFVSRALDVGRLSYEELMGLHVAENNEKRCLLPFEVTKRFRLANIKAHYGVPDGNGMGIAGAQAKWAEHVRREIAGGALNKVPVPHSVHDLETAHPFDLAVFEAVEKLAVNLTYEAARGRNKKPEPEPVAAPAVPSSADRRAEADRRELWTDV